VAVVVAGASVVVAGASVDSAGAAVEVVTASAVDVVVALPPAPEQAANTIARPTTAASLFIPSPHCTDDTPTVTLFARTRQGTKTSLVPFLSLGIADMVLRIGRSR